MLPGVPLVLISILYWLSLATWFGGAVFVAVAAPSIFRTVRETETILPTVLSVNLEGQHGTLLAGSIVNNLLGSLARLAWLCSGGLLLAFIGEWVLVAKEGHDWVLPLGRSSLYIAAVALAVYDARVVRPKVEEARQTYMQSVAVAREVLTGVRMGRGVSVRRVIPSIASDVSGCGRPGARAPRRRTTHCHGRSRSRPRRLMVAWAVVQTNVSAVVRSTE